MSDDLGPRCGPDEHCITCGDHAVAMRVVGPEARGLALCADETGAEELIDTTLVSPIAAGDQLLVHAGVALTILAAEPA